MLIVLCGLSFSGQSTIGQSVARIFEAPVVSLDAINEVRGLQFTPVHSSSPRFLRDEWRAIASTIGARFDLVYVHADAQMIRNRV